MDEALHIGLEPDLEQQQDDAYFCQQLEHLPGLQPFEHAGTEHDAGQQFAYHCRHGQAHGHLCKQPCRKQDDHQLQEKSVGFHDLGIEFPLGVAGQPRAFTTIWAR